MFVVYYTFIYMIFTDFFFKHLEAKHQKQQQQQKKKKKEKTYKQHPNNQTNMGEL